MRGGGFVAGRGAVEAGEAGFVLDDDGAEAEAVGGVEGLGGLLGGGGEEEEGVGDVAAAAVGAGLDEPVPAEIAEGWEDEAVLGFGFAGSCKGSEVEPTLAETEAEGFDVGGVEGSVAGGFADAVVEEKLGEEAACCHALPPGLVGPRIRGVGEGVAWGGIRPGVD